MEVSIDPAALASLDLIRDEGNSAFSERRETERRYESFRDAAYGIAGNECVDQSRSDALGYTLVTIYGMTQGKNVAPLQRMDLAMGEIEKRAEMHPRANWHAIKGALDGVIEGIGREKFAHMLFSAETTADYSDSMVVGPVNTEYLN